MATRTDQRNRARRLRRIALKLGYRVVKMYSRPATAGGWFVGKRVKRADGSWAAAFGVKNGTLDDLERFLEGKKGSRPSA